MAASRLPMSRNSVRAWFLVHKWTSLICTAFLLLLCVTGLPLIFHHEIDEALGQGENCRRSPARNGCRAWMR